MQYDSRKVPLFIDAMFLAKPEIFIAHATGKFDDDGRCIDEATRVFAGKQMGALAARVADIRAMSRC